MIEKDCEERKKFIDKVIFLAQPWLSFLSFPPNLIPDISTLKVLEKNPSTDLTKCCAHKNEDEKYFQDKQNVFASRLYLLSLKYLLSILASKFLCAHCNCSTNCYRSQNYEAGSVQSRSSPEDINFFCRFNCDVDKFKEIVFFSHPIKVTPYLKTFARVGSEAIIQPTRTACEVRRRRKNVTLSIWLSAQPFMRYFVSHCVWCELWFSRGFSSPMPPWEYHVSTGMDEGLRKSMNNVSERWSDRFFPP